jgi:hypothetical protein
MEAQQSLVCAMDAPVRRPRRRGRRDQRVRRVVLETIHGPQVLESESEAVLLKNLLDLHTPPGVEASVRRLSDGWLSVLFTGLPSEVIATTPCGLFLANWCKAVERFYDGRGGCREPVDCCERHPDVPWAARWERYEVRHRRGLPYW